MDENEFKVGGKVYVSMRGDTCNGCAFDSVAQDVPCRSYLPSCIDSDRKDGEFVIFVEKQP